MNTIKFSKNSITLILCSALVFQTVHAEIVYDPWNVAQTTLTAEHTAQQLLTQAEQLKVALNNAKNYDGNVGQWANIQPLLQRLGGEVQQGQSLAYNMQKLDSQFKQKFPGFTAPTDYQRSYQSWSQTTLDTLQGTLGSVGMQASEFSNEQNTLNALSSLSKTATGRMQAAQVGNMIATQQVAQLQQLRQLVMTQVNAENTYAAAQVQEKQAQEAAAANWINNGDTQFPAYGQGQSTPSESH